MHTIQHTVLINFWPMALEKPTRGKPVKERELYYSSGKKSDNPFTVKNTSYLNLAGCLVFCANVASIFVQPLFENSAKIAAKPQPRFLCRNLKNLPQFLCLNSRKSVLYRQH